MPPAENYVPRNLGKVVVWLVLVVFMFFSINFKPLKLQKFLASGSCPQTPLNSSYIMPTVAMALQLPLH